MNSFGARIALVLVGFFVTLVSGFILFIFLAGGGLGGALAILWCFATSVFFAQLAPRMALWAHRARRVETAEGPLVDLFGEGGEKLEVWVTPVASQPCALSVFNRTRLSPKILLVRSFVLGLSVAELVELKTVEELHFSRRAAVKVVWLMYPLILPLSLLHLFNFQYVLYLNSYAALAVWVGSIPLLFMLMQLIHSYVLEAWALSIDAKLSHSTEIPKVILETLVSNTQLEYDQWMQSQGRLARNFFYRIPSVEKRIAAFREEVPRTFFQRLGLERVALFAWAVLLAFSANYRFYTNNISPVSMMVKAAGEGDVRAVADGLAQGIPPNRANLSGWSAVYSAAAEGQLEVLELLVRNGADLNQLTYNGYSLMQIAAEGKSVAMLDYLLGKGAQVQHRTPKGDMAMHRAAYKGSREVVQWLVDKGADVNAKSDHDSTPLLIAAEYGNLEAVKVLVGAKASLDALDGDGDSALALARVRKHTEIEKLLVEAGAKIGERVVPARALTRK